MPRSSGCRAKLRTRPLLFTHHPVPSGPSLRPGLHWRSLWARCGLVASSTHGAAVQRHSASEKLLCPHAASHTHVQTPQLKRAQVLGLQERALEGTWAEASTCQPTTEVAVRPPLTPRVSTLLTPAGSTSLLKALVFCAFGILRLLPDSLSRISYSPIFKNSTVTKLYLRGFVFLPPCPGLISQASHSNKHHQRPLSVCTFAIKCTFDFSFPLRSLHSASLDDS